jgi:putative ABC transport system permease protein
MSQSDRSTQARPLTQTRPLTLTRMVWASMRYSWRVSASVALGVATATAVIVGALLVGDSMRGSLRGLTVERLGRTESVVIPGGFFDPEGITKADTIAIPLIMFDAGVVETRGEDQKIRRAGSVQIIGCDESFWQLDASGNRPEQLPSDDTVVLNESTAAELGVDVGDLVTVRLPVEQAVPADSPLGRRDIESEGLPRMKVVDVIPDRGLGRFAISPSQAAPKIIFLNRLTIGDVLQREGQANMLLFDREVTIDDLSVDLADLGLALSRMQRQFTPDDGPTETIYDYYSLTSDRLLLPEVAVDRILQELPAAEVSEISTYLANAIELENDSGEVAASVPYSTITAIDSGESLPFDYTLPAGFAAGDRIPIVLNSWAQERLGASVGTPLRVMYYEPEVENGKEIERSFEAVVSAVVPITKPSAPYNRGREATFDKPPTVYNDPDLTPTVPGVTDQDSINDWDLPFRLERKIEDEDDVYWNEYRLTPKAFLPLADGQRLFGSRFGKTTGLRISIETAPDVETLNSRLTEILTPVIGELGWSVRPIRQQQLSASRGTTPFDGLFLSLSFFVIFAAVMLIAMLFRLGLVERMKQFGTLSAVGWSPRRVAKLALGEGMLIAAVGVAIGMVGGVLYARGVLWALRSWWVGAVTVPFLTFHWTPVSLIIGVASGWLVAVVTLSITVRWLAKADTQTLLSERDLDTIVVVRSANQTLGSPSDPRRFRLPAMAAALGVFAVVIAALGASVGGQAAAGGFVGGGMLLLLAALMLTYARLRQPRTISASAEDSMAHYSLTALAARNVARHPLRSTMTIGLMGSAAFLIIAINAFQLQPTEKGTGGFSLVGQSAQPLFRDLRDPGVRAGLLGPDADQLNDTVIAPLRMRVGQDASCNNLYQATRPTVLGVPASFATLHGKDGSGPVGFEWAAAADLAAGETPWDALATEAAGTEEDPIPVVIDQNTAMWSLQMMKGVGETRSFEYEEGRPITFKVVGLLANSMLQGRLLIGESNFQRVFPEVSGYRYFLFACDPSRAESIESVLENRLGDIGMDVSDASAVLSGMLAVQNTYLRTFQSLGALGLLLGTIGLAVAQLRSVLERRQELAVLRALGFTRRRLAAMVMTETASLLLMGIGCGAVCAVLAVFPHAILSGLRPPLVEPLLIVLGIILFGMLAGLIAVRRVASMQLLESLRAE